MSRILKAGLFALNATLLVAVIGTTPAAAAPEPFKRDCCKNGTEGFGYCCNECCWFTRDCTSSTQCGDAIQT